jgi:hypothetical protein
MSTKIWIFGSFAKAGLTDLTLSGPIFSQGINKSYLIYNIAKIFQWDNFKIRRKNYALQATW